MLKRLFEYGVLGIGIDGTWFHVLGKPIDSKILDIGIECNFADNLLTRLRRLL